jgi:predicted transcriptional regulator
MTNPNELNININPDEIKRIAKKYKKLKKYMRSPLFEVKKMDGNEKVISKLMESVSDLVE